MISHNIKTAAAGSALLVALLAASVTPAAAIAGSCNATLTKYLGSKVAAQTNSGTAINMPTGKVVFTQGHAGCVVVRFTAITYAANNIDTVTISAKLDDGAIVSFPSEATFPEETSTIGHSHTVEFLFANVPAGSHTVSMQWRNPKGNMIHMLEHLTIVGYTN